MVCRINRKAVAIAVAVIFMTGSVSVCLHGPDDNHYMCHASFETHGSGHGHCGAAGTIERGADSGTRADHHDHHMCPCVSHIPVDIGAGLAMTVQFVAFEKPFERACQLSPGFQSGLYRPPIVS